MHQQRLKSKTDLVTLVAYGVTTISAITAFATAYSNLTNSLFNFTLNSGDIVATVGDKVANTITAKLISGNSQLIYFRTLQLPKGVKASFSKKSCTPNCSTKLTLSTNEASEGRYPITVEGYKGKIVKQTTFYLTLIKKGDFAFKLTNDGSKKIPQGETAISNIGVEVISGNPSAVEFSLNYFPGGLEYKFDPPSCTPLGEFKGQCKTKLYLYTGQVGPGEYKIEVKGRSQNNKEVTTAFTLIIKEPEQFDFSITDDGDKEIAVGKSVMSTITIKTLTGQPKPIIFELKSPNKYLTGTFSPTGCTPKPITNSCQSILTITAKVGIETNKTYDLMVTGQTSTLLSRSTIIKVKVNDISVNNFSITTLGDTAIAKSDKTPPTRSYEQYYAMNAVFVNLETPAKGYEEFTLSGENIPSGIKHWFEPTKCRINRGEKPVELLYDILFLTILKLETIQSK